MVEDIHWVNSNDYDQAIADVTAYHATHPDMSKWVPSEVGWRLIINAPVGYFAVGQWNPENNPFGSDHRLGIVEFCRWKKSNNPARSPWIYYTLQKYQP